MKFEVIAAVFSSLISNVRPGRVCPRRLRAKMAALLMPLTLGLAHAAGVNLVPSTATFTFTGTGLATESTVSSTDPKFVSPAPPSFAGLTSAYDVTVTAQTSGHDVTLSYIFPTGTVTQGDACVATVWYKRIDNTMQVMANASTGTAVVNVPVEEANLEGVFDDVATGNRSVQFALRGRGIWREVQVPFIAAMGGAGAQERFSIQCGGTKQEVLIGGLQVTDYGPQSVLTTSKSALDGSSQFTIAEFPPFTGASSTGTMVTGNPFFSTAYEINVPASAVNLVDVHDTCDCYCAFKGKLNHTGPITAGDTIVATFWARRDDPVSPTSTLTNSNGSNTVITNMAVLGYAFGDGATMQVPGPNGTTYTVTNTTTNVVQEPITLDGNWKQYWAPITALKNLAANAGIFQIYVGGQIQTVDIGGIQVLDLGPGTSVPIASATNTWNGLTTNQYDYSGGFLSDPWRTTALANIQLYRTGTLTLNVLGGTGTTSLANVNVTATMRKHQFAFGAAEGPKWFNSDYTGTTSPILQSFFDYAGGTALFNEFNHTGYKWNWWEQGKSGVSGAVYRSYLADDQKWLRQHGITNIRGHNLVWPKNNSTYIPTDVVNLTGTNMHQAIVNHLGGTGTRTPEPNDPSVLSLINVWDAVNEPASSRDLEQLVYNGTLGGTDDPVKDAQEMQTWFAQINAVDTAPELHINESCLEYYAAHAYLGLENYDYTLVATLVTGNSTLKGLNMEGHFGLAPTSPYTLQQVFNRFFTSSEMNTNSDTTLGGNPLRSEVTEYDTQFTDPAARAAYLTDFMTLIYSQPNFNSFNVYGVWQNDGMSSGSQQMFDANWNLTPAGEAWMALVWDKWTTNATTASNSSGLASVPAYLGRYQVTATASGVTKSYYVDLPTNAGANYNLQLTGTTGTATSVWIHEPEIAPIRYSAFLVNTTVDATAWNGYYVYSTGTAKLPSPSTNAQILRIDTEATGTVNIWLRTKTPASGGSFWTQIDGIAGGTGVWTETSVGVSSTAWRWTKMTPSPVNLAAKMAHAIQFGVDQEGTELDQVLITDDTNFSPSELNPP